MKKITNTYQPLGSALGAVGLSLLFCATAVAKEQAIAQEQPITQEQTIAQEQAKGAVADKASKEMKILNKEIKKKGDKVNVYMDLNLDQVKLASNKGLIYTPIIYNGDDTLMLPSVEVMGRKRYIYYQRTKKTATPNPLIVAKRENKEPQTLRYSYSTPYQSWMKNSKFAISHDACGCNQQLLAENILTPQGEALVTPQQLYQAYQQPKAEAVKMRQENGTARLNFRINKWDIVGDLGNNSGELATIRKTIELVKDDPDVTITRIILHGYASPDGSYANNDKLSRNRTQALQQYLQKTYSIAPKLFKVSSTAEDWEGTLEYIQSHDIPQKEAALKIIGSSMSPDEKERALAAKAGEAFRFLVDKVWPSLRRTDYTIEYDVKAFNLEEARRVMNTRPQKLSLQEMYMVANSYPKGSEEYNNVFDTAARMFPEDKLANLNAALAAIDRGDKVSAEKYLKKAGSGAEVDNAYGCLAVLNEDYDTAKQYFQKAVDGGLKGAQENLDKLNKAYE